MENQTIQPADHYFVFISYSSEDVKLAQWLQHELEDYHLPATLNGEPRQDLRKVFRDRSELSAGELGSQIVNALKCSTHLVVVCSPNSAESEWVDLEIKTFIELHQIKFDGNDKNKIFPFIIEGNSPDEYFPKTFKELRRRHIDLLGGDINKEDGGNDAAFIKVAAGLLNLPFDKLWNRYAREKAEKEQKEREQKEKLQISQSRFLAEKAEALIDEGDSYMARMLALEALPKDLNKPDRPRVAEAEIALRKTIHCRSAILRGHTDCVTNALFNPDATRVFSVAYDMCLCIWDVPSGKLLRKFKRHTKAINSMAISPDGKTLATASSDTTVLIWDIKKYNLITSPLIHEAPVWCVSYSSDGEYIISALNNGYIWVWNRQGTFIDKFNNNNADFKEIYGLNVSSNGHIYTSTVNSVKIWNFINGKMVFSKQISSYKGLCRSVQFCSNGEFILTSSHKNIYIRSVQTYSLIQSLPHNGVVHAAIFSPSGKQVFVGADNYLYIWDMAEDVLQWKKRKSIKYQYIIEHLSCNHILENTILISFNDGTVHLKSLSDQITPISIPIMADLIDFSRDGKKIVVASSIENIPAKIYRTRDFQLETSVGEIEMNKLAAYGIYSLNTYFAMFNQKGNIVCTLDDTGIRFWNSANGRIHKIKSYSCCRTVSRNGQWAVFAYKDGSMYLVNVSSGAKIKMIEKTSFHTEIHSASFSDDSNYIATISQEGNARIYSVKTGQLLCKLPKPFFGGGRNIRFSHDGSFIISASQTERINIWRWNKKNEAELLYSMIGHEGERVMDAAFSKDSKYAVSASYNKIVIWEIETGLKLEEINTKGEKKFVTFSPDGKRIISSDGTHLLVWEFTPLQKLIDETAQRFKHRGLTPEEKRKYYIE